MLEAVSFFAIPQTAPDDQAKMPETPDPTLLWA